MVYTRVSKGCLACRQKHKRCDLGRPTCQRCIRRNSTCQYRDYGGYVFKDHYSGPIVAKEARSHRRIEHCWTDFSTKTLHHSRRFFDADNTGDTCVAFFFSTFVRLNKDPLTDRGLFTNIEASYRTAHPGSPLCLATVALSGISAASCFNHGVETLWHCKTYVRACEALRTTISDPQERRRPETLLSILLLDYAENIRNMRSSQITASIHYRGALALLEQCDCDNPGLARSHPLASTTMHRTFFNALCKLPNLETTSKGLTGIGHTETLNPVLRMDEVIGRTLSLCRSAHWSGNYADFVDDISHLEEALDSWYLAVPASWKVVSMQSPATTGMDMSYDCYQSLDIASLFCQGYCVRILINELGRRAGVQAAVERASVVTLVTRIFAAVPFMLGVDKRSTDTGLRFCSTLQTWTAPAPLKWCEEEFTGEFLGLWHTINTFRFLDHILSNIIPGIPKVEVERRIARAVKDQLHAVKSRFAVVDPSGCSYVR